MYHFMIDTITLIRETAVAETAFERFSFRVLGLMDLPEILFGKPLVTEFAAKLSHLRVSQLVLPASRVVQKGLLTTSAGEWSLFPCVCPFVGFALNVRREGLVAIFTFFGHCHGTLRRVLRLLGRLGRRRARRGSVDLLMAVATGFQLEALGTVFALVPHTRFGVVLLILQALRVQDLLRWHALPFAGDLTAEVAALGVLLEMSQHVFVPQLDVLEACIAYQTPVQHRGRLVHLPVAYQVVVVREHLRAVLAGEELLLACVDGFVSLLTVDVGEQLIAVPAFVGPSLFDQRGICELYLGIWGREAVVIFFMFQLLLLCVELLIANVAGDFSDLLPLTD